MVQCVVCNSSILASGLVKHINTKHRNEITNEQLLVLNLVRHAPCGVICTNHGLKRHSNGCRVPENVQNGAVDFPIDPNVVVDANVEVEQFIIDEQLIENDEFYIQKFTSLANWPLQIALPMHKAVKDEFFKTVQRASRSYLAQPTAKNLFLLLSLPKLGLRRNIKDTRANLSLIMTNQVLAISRPAAGPLIPREAQQPQTQDEVFVFCAPDKRKITRNIHAGHYRKAANVVRGECSVAPLTPEVLTTLRSKHPLGTPHPFGDAPGLAPPVIPAVSIEVLDSIVHKLDTQSSAGISGWSADLLKLCYGSGGDDLPFRQFLYTLAQQMLMGTAPGRDMLTSSRLTPLLQAGGKIRPIACGELFYRILTRFLLRVVPLEGALLPIQLGVGSLGGVEPVVELVEREVTQQQCRYAYSLDISNAFNSVSRVAVSDAVRRYAPAIFRLAKWAYHTSSPLILADGADVHCLHSTEGVRQGDPLAPLLFSLALRPKLEIIQRTVTNLPGDHVISYLDDVTVLSDRGDLLDTLIHVFSPPPGVDVPVDGLVLNADKTRVVRLDQLIPSDTGICVFGSVVGSQAARRNHVLPLVETLETSLQKLLQLPRQEALLLLRLCLAPQLTYLLRCMDLSDCTDLLERVDNSIYSLVDRLRSSSPEVARDEIVNSLYGLPISMGGCGLTNYVKTRECARKASRAASALQLTEIGLDVNPPLVEENGGVGEDIGVVEEALDVEEALPPPVDGGDPVVTTPETQRALASKVHVKTFEELLLLLSESQRTALLDNSSKAGCGWLHVSPCGNYRLLSDEQIATGLNVRVLKADVFDRAICGQCGGENTLLHFECCPRAVVQTQYRHNFIRDSLKRALDCDRRIESEPFVNNNNHLQRADLRIGTADGGQGLDGVYGLVDIKVKCIYATDTTRARTLARQDALVVLEGAGPTGRSPVQDHLRVGRMEISAALEVAVVDCRRHYDRLQPHQPVVALVISSGGSLHKEFYNFIKTMVTDGVKRRNLILDISVALLRARAAAYYLK